MSRLAQLINEVHRRSMWQVLLIYVGGAWACYELIDTITSRFGLPEWLPAAAAVLFLLGLPFVLATAYVQEGGPLKGPADPTLIPESSDARPATVQAAATGKLFTWRNAVTGGALAFGLWGVAATGWMLLRDGAGREVAAGLDPRRVVAVPFDDRTGDSALADAGGLAAEWVTRELESALGEVVQVVPAKTVRELLSADSAAGTLDVARGFAAGTAISGTTRLAEGRLRVEAEIIDASTGTLLQGIDPVSGAIDSVGTVVAALAERVVAAVAVRFSPEFRLRRGERPPPSLAAFRENQAGLQAFARRLFPEAREHFYNANALDSAYVEPLLHVAASLYLSDPQRGESLLVALGPRQHLLSTGERAHRQWLFAWYRGELEEEYRLAEEKYRINPFLYAIDLCLSASRTNRPERAVEVMSVEAYAGAWVENSAQTWRVYARAYHMLDRLREGLKVIEQGRRRLPDDLSLVQTEIELRAALGQVPEVNTLIDRAFTLPPQPYTSVAMQPVIAALEYRAHGHSEAAKAALERARDWLASRPQEEVETPRYRYDLARVFYWTKRWEEALPVFEALVDEQPTSAARLRFLGTTLARLGRREEARRVAERLRALDQPYLWGANTAGRARIAAVLGDSADAVRLLRQAYSEGQPFGLEIHREPDFEMLRDYPPFVELVRPRG